MEHIAIMRKSWGLTEKILDGGKTVESRWYSARRRPWGAAKEGDVVYFKNSGEPVRVRAEVCGVVQFAGLTPKKVREILDMYGAADGIARESLGEFFERFRNKKYCILLFLKNPRQVRPFAIYKTGFGTQSAWITVPDVLRIRK